MLSTSFRGVARVSNGAFTNVSRYTTPTITTSSSVLKVSTYRRVHQRRYSSSKPPVPPNDGSRPIDTSSQAPTKSVSPTNGKQESKNSKRRGKDHKRQGIAKSTNQRYGLPNLPSVPSTQHLQPEDVQLAAFFSFHRPISVTPTTLVPPPSTADDFDAIFSGRQRKNVVDFTISSAVKSIEDTIYQHRAPANSTQVDPRHAMNQSSAANTELDVIHLDSLSAEDFQASTEEFVRRFRPFNPPPPPTPLVDNKESLSASTSSLPEITREMEDKSDVLSPIFSTVLTIRESTDSNGQKRYEAHITPLVRSEGMEAPGAFDNMDITAPEPSQGLSRSKTVIKRRQNRRSIYAISVRRQRKLKMKKHKYKKLLRKTRNLRRKLEKS